MAKSKERLQAIKLRRRGHSIKHIADVLDVSKASVSVWCRDIILTTNQKRMLAKKQTEAGHRGRVLGAETNRRKKLRNIAEQERMATSMVGRLSERDMLMMGIALYWGEGNKIGSGTAAIVNSDPAIVLFARDWFEILGVSRDMFMPRIFISDTHRSREKKLLAYWSNILGIPKQQFGKTIFLRGRPKKIYENHNSYYGVLALRVRKSTTLKYRILGLIKACSSPG